MMDPFFRVFEGHSISSFGIAYFYCCYSRYSQQQLPSLQMLALKTTNIHRIFLV